MGFYNGSSLGNNCSSFINFAVIFKVVKVWGIIITRYSLCRDHVAWVLFEHGRRSHSLLDVLHGHGGNRMQWCILNWLLNHWHHLYRLLLNWYTLVKLWVATIYWYLLRVRILKLLVFARRDLIRDLASGCHGIEGPISLSVGIGSKHVLIILVNHILSVLLWVILRRVLLIYNVIWWNVLWFVALAHANASCGAISLSWVHIVDLEFR